MLTLQTILVPTDFSGSSADALAVAAALACAARQGDLLHTPRVILLHVMTKPVFLEGAAVIPFDPPMYRDELLDKLEQQTVHHPGVRIEQQLVQGKPVPEILRVAEESKCDLIVMGTHGASGLRKLLMGSVAEGVARKACCSVLTVRTPLPSEEHKPQSAQAAAT